MNRSTLFRCLTLALCVTSYALAGSAAERPNIVLILADDMGYGDLKAFNPKSKIPTPHLDALAREGVCFVDAHSGGSTCRPSRYALLTGRFAARGMGTGKKGEPLIEAGRPTLASMLRESGYKTAMVGKWHLGFDPPKSSGTQRTKGIVFDYARPLTGGPVDRGFDSFFGMHASLDIPPYFYIRDRAPVMPPSEEIGDRDSVGDGEGWNRIQGAFWRAGPVSPDFKHAEVTPAFAAVAEEVLAAHDGQQPLFLYLALPSPHTPWLPSKEFFGKSGAGMYGDFVMTVDKVVGDVLERLETMPGGEHTLVLFSSDNGPVWYEKDVRKFGHSSAGVLRGIKGSAWEGGHRVPFVARWPGRIPPGTRSQRTIAFADVFATLAEVAGGKRRPPGGEDSESFLASLLDPDQTKPRTSPILHGARVIRDGDWKLINTKGSRGFSADRSKQYGIALYNLRDDLGETRNLVEQYPQKVNALRARLEDVLQGEVERN